MRIVVAPDKYKESASAATVARALAAGWRRVFPAAEMVLVPMADGGEGTVEAFVERGAARVGLRATGPLGDPVDTAFALEESTAIVEMASASGIALVPAARRDPRRATTLGTGELVRAAIERGARRIVVGVGGSATNDGGAGCLTALGARFLDARGAELVPGGAALAALAHIDLSALDARLGTCEIVVAADVDNPLCGPNGASAVFGPQKGASTDDVRELDAALAHFADVASRCLGRDVRDVPGVGAAGGLAFGLVAFLCATIRPGVDIVAELCALDDALAGAELCLTGEGRIDAQTLRGKTVAGVARHARRAGAAVIAFGGAVDAAVERELWERGVAAVAIADGPATLEASMAAAEPALEHAAARAARLYALGSLRRPITAAGPRTNDDRSAM